MVILLSVNSSSGIFMYGSQVIALLIEKDSTTVPWCPRYHQKGSLACRIADVLVGALPLQCV